MKVDKFYLLRVWLITTLFVALACACWPDIRTYTGMIYPKSIYYSIGLFAGIFIFELKYSVALFICLYLELYFLTRKKSQSVLFLKSALFVFFLIGVFIVNYFYIREIWLHPFFFVYLVGGALAFCVFTIYTLDLESLFKFSRPAGIKP
jgi:hypothetical protein